MMPAEVDITITWMGSAPSPACVRAPLRTGNGRITLNGMVYEELDVFLGIDVIRNDADGIVDCHLACERLDERRLSRAHGPRNPDANVCHGQSLHVRPGTAIAAAILGVSLRARTKPLQGGRMDYSMSGNMNTIYVDLNTSSTSFAIVTVACIFLFLAVWNGLKFKDRWFALRHDYPGFAMDAKTKRAGILAIVGLVGALLGVAVYAVNPNYEAERAQQGAAGVEAVNERFGLDARWEFSPYTPFDGQTDLIGKLYIVADGGEYPTRITQATYEGAHGKSRTSDETFVIEVLTDRGYIPISEFADEHGGNQRY